MKTREITNKVLFHLGLIDYLTRYTIVPPSSEGFSNKNFIVKGNDNYHKWIFFNCPCGCGELLSLSLMDNRDQHWDIEIDKFDRVSLSPSVWKNDGCQSHFYVKRSKIIWVRDGKPYKHFLI